MWDGVSARTTEQDSPRRHEIWGLLAGAAAVLVVLSVGSAGQDEPWAGPVGATLAETLITAVGAAVWVIPLELILLGTRLVRGARSRLGIATGASTLVLVLVATASVHLTFSNADRPGGVLGELLGEVLRALVGTAGAFVLCVTTVLVVLVLRAPWSMQEMTGFAFVSVGKGSRAFVGHLRTLWIALRETRATERAETDQHIDPVIVAPLEVITTPGSIPAGVEEEPPKARSEPRKTPRVIQPTERPIAAPPPPLRHDGAFVLPPMSLLESPPLTRIRIDEASLKNNASLLVEKLVAYGVRGRVDEIHPGPVVTMYELEPESGTKVSKIASLADDLAMALAAQKVRIVAPIPGKGRVGFEIPNEHRQTVYLREVLEDERWQNLRAALPMAFGKDIFGQSVYGDLARMPHLLVAGATGSGKSVGLNVMLTSLLLKKTPDEVRFVMIDPKMVELSVYDSIPHMLLPVVTDTKKAALALRWAVDEMERRYQLFADAGARSIDTFNARVQKVISGELDVEKLFAHRATGARGDVLPSDVVRLPYVVLVVDEFADLMMVAAKDVETAIARLAQKARAAGIHVILATQRPSVDVITGMIKANFTSRIAYKVAQREDSKTILGRSGAEHLLGAGDMLMVPPGANDLRRIHSAFISEDEVRAVCEFLRAQGQPVYDEAILKPREDDEESIGVNDRAGDDPQYDRAVAIIAQAGYCSISQIQRQLSVGYNKAAKLVERMEREGVVGPSNVKAGGRREVLVQPV